MSIATSKVPREEQKQIVKQAIDDQNGNVSAAARVLSITVRGLNKRIRALGLRGWLVVTWPKGRWTRGAVARKRARVKEAQAAS